MWQLLSLLVSLGSPFSLIRRLRQRLYDEQGPQASPWAERGLNMPYYATRRGLEVDIWRGNRESLSFDAWKGERRRLKTDRVKSPLRGIPDRRVFLLEEMDGGETLNGMGRRRKPSRNARQRRLVSEEEVERMFGKLRKD